MSPSHRRPTIRTLFSLAALALALLANPSAARAETITIELDELDAALAALPGEPDALRRLALERVAERLDAAGLGFEDGALLYAETFAGERFESGCNRTEVRTVSASARVAGDSALSLTLDSLREPIRVALSLEAAVEASGEARQRFGVSLFGRCRGYARDTFAFEASGPLALDLAVELELDPRFDRASNTLELTPRVRVAGGIRRFELALDVDDSLLERTIERLLRRRVDAAFDPVRIGESIAALEDDLETALDAELDDGVLRLRLPDPDDAQLRALIARLAPDARFPLPIAYVRARAPELFAALILGDEARVTELLGEAAVCEAASLLEVPLPHVPLYAVREEGCAAVRLPGGGAPTNGPFAEADERLHADAACQRPLDVRTDDAAAFCALVLDDGRLGNAAVDTGTLDAWTLSPGTRLDILARPLAGAGMRQPLTRRVAWKSVETAQGTCRLGMRIHSARPGLANDGGPAATTPLRPLIAFHGGSWQRRSTGFLGIESMAPRFTEAGFVVFAPFHRLIDVEEGNAACNGATLDAVLEDVDDALDWVVEHAADYGAAGAPVVFGQSSGGHLAAALAVTRPDDVDRAALFYAPLDFGNFVRQAAAAAGGASDTGGTDGDEADVYRSEAGRRTLELVVGAPLETIADDDPLVLANSFPPRVARARAAGARVPPMFLLHGEADELVPARQSVRMCDALAGSAEAGPAARALASESPDGAPSLPGRVVRCDAVGSELHLVAEGRHALDLCIADGLCLAGSRTSAASVSGSVGRMLEWIAAPLAVEASSSTGASGAAGGSTSGAGGDATRDDDGTNGGVGDDAIADDDPGNIASDDDAAPAIGPDAAGSGGGSFGPLLPLLALASGTFRRRRPVTSRT